MKLSFIWSALETVAPRFAKVCRAVRSRQRSGRLEKANGAVAVVQKIIAQNGMMVQSGPFSGMHLPEELSERGIGPKLLGTYERELEAWLAEAISHEPKLVAVVGSAEGYYAVGLGRALPKAKVLAFDIDPWARTMCRKLAEENGVGDRLEVRSFCSSEDLRALADVHALVVSDCEGFEYQLFTPDAAGCLQKSWVLIETHAHLGFDDSVLLRALSQTHAASTIRAEERSQILRPTIAPFLSESDFALAVNEFRIPTQEWIVAKPNSQQSVEDKRNGARGA